MTDPNVYYGVKEPPRCACNTQKRFNMGVYMCPNCDNVQVSQYRKNPVRTRTEADVRLDLHWSAIMKREYPEIPKEWLRDANN